MSKPREPEIELLLKHAKNFLVKKLDEIADFAVDNVTEKVRPETTTAPPPPRLSREQLVDSVLMAHVLAGGSLRSSVQRDALRRNILKALDSEGVEWDDVTDKP